MILRLLDGEINDWVWETEEYNNLPEGMPYYDKKEEKRKIKMNQYKAKVEVLRHQMQLRAGMTSDNPYHNQHIEDFCDYADAIAKGEAQEVREEVPGIVQ